MPPPRSTPSACGDAWCTAPTAWSARPASSSPTWRRRGAWELTRRTTPGSTAAADRSGGCSRPNRGWSALRSALLAVPEQRDRLLDASLPGLGALGGVDVVHVVALHAVRELGEEGCRCLVGGQGDREVLGNGDLARAVRDGQGDLDGGTAYQTGGLSDGRTDADHLLVAHHRDSAAVLVAVDVHEHWWPLPGAQCGNDGVGDDDAGVVAAGGHGRLECRGAGLGRGHRLPRLC